MTFLQLCTRPQFTELPPESPFQLFRMLTVPVYHDKSIKLSVALFIPFTESINRFINRFANFEKFCQIWFNFVQGYSFLWIRYGPNLFSKISHGDRYPTTRIPFFALFWLIAVKGRFTSKKRRKNVIFAQVAKFCTRLQPCMNKLLTQFLF